MKALDRITLAILALVAVAATVSALAGPVTMNGGTVSPGTLRVFQGAPGTAVTLSTSAVDANMTVTAGVAYACFSTVDTHIKLGGAATTSDTPIAAKTVRNFIFAATGASNPALHAINDSGSGTLFCTPMTAAE